MGKNLKTMEEHDRERMADYNESENKSCLNGIACPECGEELIDSSPSVVYASNPPKKKTHCPKCQYNGFRIA